MIIFVVIIAIIGIAFFLIYNHNKNGKIPKKQEENTKSGNWIKIFIIINICVICFFRLLFPGVIKYSDTTICFYLLLLINIVTIVLVFNRKIIKKKLIINCTIIVYFLLIMLLPAYKFEDHEHVFDNTKTYSTNISGTDYTFPYEKIVTYVDYYNCYGLKLNRIIK